MLSGTAKSPLIVAHRGASTVEIENTIPAFEKAVMYGADAIELDIRWTADDRAVVFHDPSVTQDGRKIQVRKMPADELRRLKSAEQVALPTMREILEWAKGQPPLVFDIKDTRREEEFIQEVEACGFHADSIFSSFRLTVIGKIKASRPNWQTAWIIGNSGSATLRRLLLRPIITRAVRWGAGALHFHHSWIRPEVISRCHKEDLRVAAWTVDDPARMREISALGVDAIITNVPDIAVATLRASPPLDDQ